MLHVVKTGSKPGNSLGFDSNKLRNLGLCGKILKQHCYHTSDIKILGKGTVMYTSSIKNCCWLVMFVNTER